MRKLELSFWGWCGNIVIAGIYFFTLFYLVRYYRGEGLDIKAHNFILQDYLSEGGFPTPPGYYAMLYALDLVIRYRHPFVLSSILLLTYFFWLKFRIAFLWFFRELRLAPFDTGVMTVSLLLVSPIFIPAVDGNYWYLGKFTPTIWHNSTLIAVFPFCLLLFDQTLRWIETGQNKQLCTLVILGLAALLIKPSFLFCYIPALPLFIWTQSPPYSGRLWVSIILSAGFLGALFVEKVWIYDLDPVADIIYGVDERSSVVLNPLKIHLNFSKEPFFDFLCSFPSTIVFLTFWGREAFRDRHFTFSFILLCFALLVYLLFAETGFREFHGNFYWQIPITMFLHYVFMLILVVRRFIQEDRKLKAPILFFMITYLIQVGMGLAYWLRMFLAHELG